MKNKKIRAILFLILAAVGIFFDQWTKRLAVLHLMNQPSKKIIPGVFELSYLENPGAAFGMMRGKQFLFFVIMARTTHIYSIVSRCCPVKVKMF